MTDINARFGGAFSRSPSPPAANYPGAHAGIAAASGGAARRRAPRGVVMTRYFDEVMLERPAGAREARLDRLSLPARPAVSAWTGGAARGHAALGTAGRRPSGA